MKAVDKGPAENFFEDGNFHAAELSGRADFRGDRVEPVAGRERYFTGTSSRIEGVDMEVLAREALMKHEFAMHPPSESDTELRVGGEYQYRVRGERHLLNPLTVSKLQHAVRQCKTGDFSGIRENCGPAEPRLADAARHARFQAGRAAGAAR